MLRKAEFVILLLLTLLFNSCYYQSQNKTNAWDIYNDVGNESFFSLHHYSQNSNFVVIADSIVLICQQPDELPFDSLTIYKEDCIVVADVMQLPINEEDSVWVKVARDQYTQGWISERKLLSMVVPPDPVSYFISLFSYVPLLFIITTVLFLVITYYKKKVCNHGVYFVLINDIKSFYPTLLTVLIAIASVYYATLKMVDFETCRHFYFYTGYTDRRDQPLCLCRSCRHRRLCRLRHRPVRQPLFGSPAHQHCAQQHQQVEGPRAAHLPGLLCHARMHSCPPDRRLHLSDGPVRRCVPRAGRLRC